MICSNCGAENPDGSKFCSLCLKLASEPGAACPDEDAPTVTPGLMSPVYVAEEASPRTGEPGAVLARLMVIDTSNLAIYGLTAAFSVACLVYVRLVAEMLARMFVVESASFNTATGAIFSETFLIPGVLLGLTAVLGANAVAACLLGFRAQQSGAMLGGIMAAGVCVADGILSLFGFGSLYRIVKVLDSSLGLSLVCFAASTSVLVVVGALSGFEGEKLARSWPWKQWTFDRIIIVAFLATAVLLTPVGVVGALTGDLAGPAAGLTKAYEAMREEAGWQADISYILEDGEEETLGKLVHEKGEGYTLRASDSVAGISASLDFTEDGSLDLPQFGHLQRTIPSFTGVVLFGENMATELEARRGKSCTFEDEEALCYMVKGSASEYEIILLLGVQIPGSPLLSASPVGSFEAIIWTSPFSDTVLGIAFLMRDQGSPLVPGSGGQLILLFSGSGGKALEGARTPIARGAGPRTLTPALQCVSTAAGGSRERSAGTSA